MRYVCAIAAIAFSLGTPAPVAAQSGQQGLVITNYQFVNEQRLTRTKSHVTYRADVVNSTDASFDALTATVTSLVSSVEVVPGQTNLHFGRVPAHGRATSIDTFTILVDRSVLFDWGNIAWSFLAPVANAGPNQTVAVGATVILNGSGSTDPSGTGTLDYNWTFVSRPAGTAAVLMYATTVAPRFVIDVPGNYVISLTVSNGVATDTDFVTISTTNSPPVANAGPNQTVPVGAKVTLNGAGSSDVDGDLLSFAWTLISRPPLSTAVLNGSSSVAPTFVADRPGKYIAELIVHDGKVASPPATVTITTENTPPVADAGPNQIVAVGSVVEISGTASTDVDGDALTYQWLLTTRPDGSAATLSNPNTVKTTFTADLAGTYVAQLIVHDGTIASAPATVTVTTNALQAPVAFAGPNQTVVHGTEVALNGSGTDPQGLTLTYSWSFTSRPAESAATLSNPTASGPKFIADWPGTYVVQLIVSNGFVSSAPSTVTITTTNTAPVANPGKDQYVASGVTVYLDGRGSSDADGDPLTYAWSLTTKPAGSNAGLIGAASALPTFVADVAGIYVAQLIVNDGFTNSVPVTVTISAGLRTISLSPSPLNLYSAPGILTVTLGEPAGPGGQIVNLASLDEKVVTVTPTVTVAEGSATASVSVTPVAPGSTSITGFAATYQPGTVVVNVHVPAIKITLSAANVGVTRSISGALELSAPAPVGGAAVTLAAAPPGRVTLDPASITIAEGSSTGSFTVTGAAEGTATITATSPGYTDGTASVDVRTLGAIFLQSDVTVGAGQSAPLGVTLATPAPAGGVTITLTSSDEFKVTVTGTVSIEEGSSTPAVPARVNGIAYGSSTITASAPGFIGASTTVQVGRSLSFTPPSLTIAAGGSGNLILSIPEPAPAGGLTASVTSSNTGVATVASATVTIPQSATSVSVPVTGIAAGTAVIRASAPGIADATADVTVTSSPDIILPASVVVAPGESEPFPVSLARAATSPVMISLVSSDTSKVTLSVATLYIGAGQTTPTSVPRVNGVAAGSATITASAYGYRSASETVTVGLRLNFQPDTLEITGTATKLLTLTLSGAAPAQGLTVGLSSSNTNVATVQSSVTFPASARSVSVPVTGVAQGSAVITATAPGMPQDTANITVLPPGTIDLPANATVPLSQTAPFAVVLSTPAPIGGVTVTLASSDAGKATISPESVYIAQGATSPVSQPQLAGVNVGAVTITASATGYTTASRTVQVTATVTWLQQNVTISANSTQNLQLRLSAGAPWAGLTVNLVSSNTAVAAVQPSINFFPDGSVPTTVVIPVHGVAPGTATITASGTNIPEASATVTVVGALTITTASLPSGQVGQSYSQTLAAGGGQASYSWALTSGVLPAGLTLNPSTGQISGTPTAAGTASLTFRVTDSSNPPQTATKTLSLTIAPAQLSITSASLANGQVGVAYSQTLAAAGGTPEYTWALAGGVLPAGLGLNAATGQISGTPTAAATSVSLTFRVTDSSNPVQTATKVLTLTIAPAGLSITTTSLANGQAGVPYSQFLAASGGTPGYTWAVTSGTLPAGLSLNASTGEISGTPTTPINSTPLIFRVTDSSNPVQTATRALTLTIAPPGLSITTVALPDGQVGVLYSHALAASGGTPSYTWAIISGSLPPGLTLNASTGAITGTPNTVVTATPLTVRVTDSGNPAQTATKALTLTITPPGLAISTNSLANGQVGVVYSQTLAAAGGTPGYTWALTAGTLPAGLTLTAATGQIGGTPTEAVASRALTFRVTDSGNPAQTATKTLSLTIAPAPLSITTSALPNGQVGVAYSQSLAAAGGTPGYTWALTAGALPAGLTLNMANGQITGTPTEAATNRTLTFRVTDSGTPAQVVTKTLSLTIAPAPVSITTATLAMGQVTVAYSQTLAATGGTPGYTWALTAGALPAGLTLHTATGEIAGTPTEAVTNRALTFRVTDSGTPAQTATKTFNLTIEPAPLTITTAALPIGQVGIAYLYSLAAAGGTPGYTWSLISGALPGGLGFNPANGQISGTPTEAVTNRALTFQVTDSSSPAKTATRALSLTIMPPPVTITTAALPAGMVGAAYQATVQATGGTGPYTWTVASGALPAGLSLTTGGQILGTPNVAGSTPVTFRVADSSIPQQSATATLSITIAPAPIGSISLTNATVGYNLQATVTVTLSAPAQSGLSITISSSDSNLVRMASNPGSAGVSPFVVPVSAGSTQFFFYVQALASSGTVTLTASAPGYSSGTATVTLAPSGFVLEGPNGIGASFISNRGTTTGLTVRSYRLDQSFNPVQGQQVRGGASAIVTLQNSNPAAGTVTPSVAFSGGTESASAAFNAVAQGSTTITAQPPAGYAAPGGGANVVVATVQAVGMTVSFPDDKNKVGYHLQTPAQIMLTGAPSSDLTVNVLSSDSSRLKLSTTPDGAGQPSISLTIKSGFSFSPSFYVQGFAASGTADITANAFGYPSATGTVTLTPAGFVIKGPNGIGVNFSTTTTIGNSNIEVYPARLDAPNTYAEVQALAGGLSTNVTVTSSNPAVGTITSPTVTIAGGSYIGMTQFRPMSAGATLISVGTPAGFTTPGQGASMTATVGTANLVVEDGMVVGRNLQQITSVLLGGIAPEPGVTVTLTSNAPGALQLAATGTGPGSNSITLTIPAGEGGAYFYVRALAGSGTAGFTATAQGYGPDTTTVTLAPSGVVLQGVMGTTHYVYLSGGDFSPMTVRTTVLDPSTHMPLADQELAGGLSLDVTLTNDEPSIGTVASPVTIAGGTSSTLAPFTPLTTGTTIVRVTQPSGYTLPNEKTAVTVIVM